MAIDEISVTTGEIILDPDDDVDEDDWASIETCRLFEGFPARLNSLDKVSVGCTMVAPALTEIAALPTCECSARASAGTIVERGIDDDNSWVTVLLVRSPAGEVALDATSDVGGVTVGMVEEVVAKMVTSELVTIEGIIEDIDEGVKVWTSAGIEAVSV